jgi:hypothetical protein
MNRQPSNGPRNRGAIDSPGISLDVSLNHSESAWELQTGAANQQGKRILIPQQMQQVAIVPASFQAFSVDAAF